MKGLKYLVNLGLALGMLLYAVPRLQIGGGFSAETMFGAVWICFAILIIAANLHEILGVEEETRERLRQVKRMRRYQTEQKIMGRG